MSAPYLGAGSLSATAQHIKNNVNTMLVVKNHLQEDTSTQLLGRCIGFFPYASEDISTSLDVDGNEVITFNGKEGGDPKVSATEGEDSAIVFVNATLNAQLEPSAVIEVLIALDVTDRNITNGPGDTIRVTPLSHKVNQARVPVAT
jgi:hypothetical protein